MAARDDLPPAIYVFLVVNFVAVGLRVFVRTCISKAFSYDDWAMLAAFVGFIVLCTLTLLSLSYGYGAAELRPGYSEMEAVKYFVSSTIAYVIVVYISKISVALVLFRIAVTNRPIRILLLVSMGALTAWTIVSTLIVAFQCRPLSLAWNEGEGTCLPAYVLANTGYSISAMDIGSSFLFAALPIFLLRGVKLSIRVKASIVILLGLGVISSIVTVIRLKYLVDVSNLVSPTGVQAANAYLTTFVYSVIELGLTIFTASLAALRPLLKYVPFGSTTLNSRRTETREEMGRKIKLEEIQSGTGSQDQMVPPKGRVAKHTRYEVTFSEV